jgi:hypothetical protein
MTEPAIQSRPDAENYTQGHKYIPFYLIHSEFLASSLSWQRCSCIPSLHYLFNLTRSLPPVGVYLLEGQCDGQVGTNIVCWFFFITPCTFIPHHITNSSLSPWIQSSCIQETLA